MRKIAKIAQREYIETAKTKTFIVGVLMAPLIVGGIVFFSSRVAKDKKGPRKPLRVAVTDLSEELADEIKTAFDNYNKGNEQRQINLQKVDCTEQGLEEVTGQQKERLRSRDLDIYVVVDKDVVNGSGGMNFYMCGAKLANLDAPYTVESLLNEAIVNRRCEVRNISPDLLGQLRRHVRAEQIEVGAAGAKEQVESEGRRITKMMVPFFFMYLMFLGILGAAQQMLTSVIEEKSSRVIEVLLSAVSPFELLAGKILGLAGIGLTVMGLWAVAAYSAARWQGLSVEVTKELAAYFMVYYILGFVLFSAILAGLGSICNTLKEAQSLMMPITLVFILPLLSWFNMARHPNDAYARILSFIPPLTPVVMVLRLSAGGTGVFDIVGSIAVLLVSVPVVMWVGAKVFRTGILMYGKRPGLREVLRWIRQS
ncbi:MAG: ABC transporter permease [Planctomycetota bacterium]|jgi:ABC-2 type transport system permease protein